MSVDWYCCSCLRVVFGMWLYWCCVGIMNVCVCCWCFVVLIFIRVNLGRFCVWVVILVVVVW